MGPARSLRGLGRELDTLVARTPPERDRYVDFLRLAAIAVVVLWHWSLSVLHWSGERWVMPNPIHAVPGGWLATWPLQIVTVFFIVGGYANAAGWRAARRSGAGLAGYYRSRARRLLLPVAVFVAVWAAVDLTGQLLVPGYPGVLRFGIILFTPLWFIAAYLWVVLLTPLTVSLHERVPWWTVGLLAATVIAADLGRFGAGIEWLGWVNSALVWVLVHQFGYFFRDGTLTALGTAGAVILVMAAVLLLFALTATEPYPRSMVATVDQPRSNILPTTLPIAVVALLQLGLILLVRRPVRRWLRRPGVWKPVVAGNAVILTVFLWHMTALMVVLAALHGLGVTLPTQPTLDWWLARPFWVVTPALVLGLLVAVFGRFEWGAVRR